MNLETGNEPVEENCLESKIRDIQAKTLDEQPDNGRKLEPFLPERDNRHHDHPRNNQSEKDGKRFQVVLHKDHQPENHQDDKRHHTVDLRKKPRRILGNIDDIH